MTRLEKILVPPEVPLGTSIGARWDAIEREHHIQFPDDYKEFVARFGTGCIDGFLWVYTPLSSNRNLNIFAKGEGILETYRHLRAQPHDEVPYPIYPEPEGLYPWGGTDNGDRLFWLSSGSTADWPIVVTDSRAPDYERYDMTMTEFLARILEGSLKCGIFPDDFPSSRPLFRPWD